MPQRDEIDWLLFAKVYFGVVLIAIASLLVLGFGIVFFKGCIDGYSLLGD
jgi:hypothetical protein